MPEADEEVTEDDTNEALLREARVPEFAWDHTLRTLDHDLIADGFNEGQYMAGHLLLFTGPSMRTYDTVWYCMAKHLVLQTQEIEFMSLLDVVSIASGETKDTAADHVFIEGFTFAECAMPLSPHDEHLVKEQMRYWIMNDVCVYPYVVGSHDAMRVWWKDDFVNYLCELLVVTTWNP